MKHILASLFLVLGFAASAAAQTIPQPSSPVAFCGTQAAPAGDPTQVIFDGGAPEAATFVTPTTSGGSGAIISFCNANQPGWTHAFTLPAARFNPRVAPYTIAVISTNAFGQTTGPVFQVTVGLAPGQFTITGVGILPQ
jgi:hypothetical protein